MDHQRIEYFDPFSKFIQSSKNNEFDLDRLIEIHQTIDGIYLIDKENIPIDSRQIFPIEISGMIEGYDYNRSLGDIYKRVMNRLKVSKEEMKNLDFYDESFVQRLYSILISRNLEFPSHDLFKYDLSKLVFKWMIHMRQETIDNDEKFEKASNSIKLIASLINQENEMQLSINFKLKFMKSFEFPTFKGLLKAEFFENSHIFHSLTFAIEYFYLDKNGNKRSEIKGIDCNELKIKYFNGNYEKNILLKYLMIIYDPKGEMRKCIIKDDPHASCFGASLLPANKSIMEYLENLRLKGPEKVEDDTINFISRSMIEYFLLHDRKFLILIPFHLFCILERIRGTNLLTRQILEKFLEFATSDGDIRWDQRKCKSFLKKYMKIIGLSKDDIQKCNEYLKLITSSIV